MSNVGIRLEDEQSQAGIAAAAAGNLRPSQRRGRSFALAVAVLLGAGIATASANAETGWVKDELRLNLRTGAGTDFRILGVLKTGDRVDILSRQKGWIQIRTNEGTEGWLPRGYLQADAPAAVIIERNQSELVALQEQLAQDLEQRSEIEAANEALTARNAEQTQTVERLTRENVAFRSGQRWPEWITGSLILGTGLVLGWALKANANRSRTSRVRL